MGDDPSGAITSRGLARGVADEAFRTTRRPRSPPPLSLSHFVSSMTAQVDSRWTGRRLGLPYITSFPSPPLSLPSPPPLPLPPPPPLSPPPSPLVSGLVTRAHITRTRSRPKGRE